MLNYADVHKGDCFFIPAGLVLMENHLSGFVIIMLIGVTVMWIGGANKWIFSIGFFVVAALVIGFVFLCKRAHRNVGYTDYIIFEK